MSASEDQIKKWREDTQNNNTAGIILQFVFDQSNSIEVIENSLADFFADMDVEQQAGVMKRIFHQMAATSTMLTKLLLGIEPEEITGKSRDLNKGISWIEELDKKKAVINPTLNLRSSLLLSSGFAPLTKDQVDAELDSAILHKKFEDIADLENRVMFSIVSMAIQKFTEDNDGKDPKFDAKRPMSLEYQMALWLLILDKKLKAYP